MGFLLGVLRSLDIMSATAHLSSFSEGMARVIKLVVGRVGVMG